MSSVITVRSWLFNFTGQAAHFFAAAYLMSTIRRHASFHHSFIAYVVGLSAAAIKEFWYDYKYETAEERGSSLLDFTMYAVGLSLGLFLQ